MLPRVPLGVTPGKPSQRDPEGLINGLHEALPLAQNLSQIGSLTISGTRMKTLQTFSDCKCLSNLTVLQNSDLQSLEGLDNARPFESNQNVVILQNPGLTASSAISPIQGSSCRIPA